MTESDVARRNKRTGVDELEYQEKREAQESSAGSIVKMTRDDANPRCSVGVMVQRLPSPEW